MPRRRTNPSKPKITQKWVSKPKVMQKWVRKPNWLELPPDLIANILHRLGTIEILESAQKVCTAWYKICKDPAMWRVIDMHNPGDLFDMPYDLEKMCKHAIDRSQGQLVDINIEYFGTDDLIRYMVNRSCKLKCLQVVCCSGSIYECWSELFKTLPLLEELSLILTEIPKEAIADAGKHCPLLRSFKFNQSWMRDLDLANDREFVSLADEDAIAIGKTMTQLNHLQLIGNSITNKGLQAILDGCPYLVSLDLRRCFSINLDSGLGKRCFEQLKVLRLPMDSMEGYEFQLDDDDEDDDFPSHGYFDNNSDYEGLSDYDIYCGPYYNPYKDIFNDRFDDLPYFANFLAAVEGMHIEDPSTF